MGTSKCQYPMFYSLRLVRFSPGGLANFLHDWEKHCRRQGRWELYAAVSLLNIFNVTLTILRRVHPLFCSCTWTFSLELVCFTFKVNNLCGVCGVCAGQPRGVMGEASGDLSATVKACFKGLFETNSACWLTLHSYLHYFFTAYPHT